MNRKKDEREGKLREGRENLVGRPSRTSRGLEKRVWSQDKTMSRKLIRIASSRVRGTTRRGRANTENGGNQGFRL